MIISEIVSALLMSVGLLVGVAIGSFISLPPTFSTIIFCTCIAVLVVLNWILMPPFELEESHETRRSPLYLLTFIGLPCLAGQLGSMTLRTGYHTTLHLTQPDGVPGIYAMWILLLVLLLWSFISVIVGSTKRDEIQKRRKKLQQ
mmetsp:Transcript_36031/g.46282  ORF Transcript_36031/g.46282 Transcript_36031/m.46282 type:complete len:145 (-) Transcript_36031:28-462(-)